jgi:hypothetical protein
LKFKYDTKEEKYEGEEGEGRVEERSGFFCTYNSSLICAPVNVTTSASSSISAVFKN